MQPISDDNYLKPTSYQYMEPISDNSYLQPVADGNYLQLVSDDSCLKPISDSNYLQPISDENYLQVIQDDCCYPIANAVNESRPYHFEANVSVLSTQNNAAQSVNATLNMCDYNEILEPNTEYDEIPSINCSDVVLPTNTHRNTTDFVPSCYSLMR